MPMTTAYLNQAAAAAASITHIGLVDETGTELTGGSYARQAVAWTAAANGLRRPTADLTFAVPAGKVVGGWRGFSALTAGTAFGGEDVTEETYSQAGNYVLAAAQTGIQHSAV